MKKKIVLIVLSLVLVFAASYGLTSCAKQDDAGTKQQTTGDVTTEPETNETEAADTQTTDKESITINTDLLDEYMMTYGELSKKHGELIGYERFDGGNHYLFKNGYGYYAFYLGESPFEWVTDPETNIEFRKIDDDEVCRGLRNIAPEVLFEGSFETISIEDIAGIEGINYVNTAEDGIVTSRPYASLFTYDGWNSDKVQLLIFHEDKDMIDLTSEARIYIHPQDVRAELSQDS